MRDNPQGRINRSHTIITPPDCSALLRRSSASRLDAEFSLPGRVIRDVDEQSLP
jgi:hypothetical protein